MSNVMQSIARELDGALNGDDRPRKFGFALFIFPFDAPAGARTSYVSNGQRSDMVAALKDILARFDGQPSSEGRA